MPVNSLFVFTKPNRMGMSKTRLARETGVSEARRINAMSTAKVMRQIGDPRWQTALMIAPDRAVTELTPQWPIHFARFPQGGGNLGDRMRAAFDLAPLGKVAFIGTDMPDLKRGHIASAFRLLNQNDVVFGPADDGGFWLYSQTKHSASRAPFDDVRWSSEYALADVRQNLGNARIAYLQEMVDLDDLNALKKWRAKT